MLAGNAGQWAEGACPLQPRVCAPTGQHADCAFVSAPGERCSSTLFGPFVPAMKYYEEIFLSASVVIQR